MIKLKKVLMGVAALAALAFGGATVAGATGVGNNDNDNDGELSGAVEKKAGDAALDSAGGGKVLEVELSDEGGPAVYEVKVAQATKTLEVQLDKGFKVTSSKLDDDQNEADGDQETDDDGQSGAAQ